MNGSCAGGTGAFIDQMASLLNVDNQQLDQLSFQHKTVYPIASRCGVFAKSDIQPLLNQGAEKADIAASIFQSIVNQTIAGLAQGRQIKGKVVFLGGPLTFLLGLRERFVKTLQLGPESAIFPENGEFYVAIGAALCSLEEKEQSAEELARAFIKASQVKTSVDTLPQLFFSQEEYDEFQQRHAKASIPSFPLEQYSGRAYLGIDAGSTTTKLVLIDEQGRLLHQFYQSSKGEPLLLIKEQLSTLYELCGDRVTIAASAVTGYGEELLRHAFHADFGIVETVAHYTAAKTFSPDVDFIIDIGGQDMKCFKLKNGAVDSILLNEACSSGCGSFIETFALAAGYDVASFAALGIFAEHPVNLGSRCTVFMNSSVKQAQKDGASIGDISAGLSISVVKNAVYKVIRARSAADLGSHVVVQGGTFLNDAILRAFELETGRQVIRPAIAGLMGAYGAALYAMQRQPIHQPSKLLGPEEVADFMHTASLTNCEHCQNHCKITVNTFANGEKFISGNRCDRPLGKAPDLSLANSYEYKLKKLFSYRSRQPSRGKIGLPMGLNMYENLPFWFTLLNEMGFEVVLSGLSNKKLYTKGQYTISSDTVCYPAKLMHGHIEALLEKGVDTIFYPCMPYNFNEEQGDNHYNCPVVAYYPELLAANVKKLEAVRFLNPYFAPHTGNKFKRRAQDYFLEQFRIPKKISGKAVDTAYQAYAAYKEDLYSYGDNAIEETKRTGKPLILLASRPYHVDPEINHGIHKMLASLGVSVISEDCLRPTKRRNDLHVLNQWTYHSRLYHAAHFVGQHPELNLNLIQLVSFGCGLDAITTDEVRDILERYGKIYTQIKIDEISNLGAAKIRVRSLLEVAALSENTPGKGGVK